MSPFLPDGNAHADENSAANLPELSNRSVTVREMLLVDKITKDARNTEAVVDLIRLRLVNKDDFERVLDMTSSEFVPLAVKLIAEMSTAMTLEKMSQDLAARG